MTQSVSTVRSVLLTHRLLVRQLLTPGRLLALLSLGAVVVLAAVGVAASDEVEDPARTIIEVMDGLGLVLVVPVVSLVFASASLGELREDGTLVYLWLRPMDRLSVVAGAYLAALTVSLPLTTLPLAAAALVGKATVDGVIATVVAASFGVLAYSAAFVLLGLMIRNPIIWGLAYVLVWEGIFARFSEPVGNAAVRGYTRSLLANLSDVGLGPAAEANTSTAVLVCVFVAAGSLAMAAVRLNRMEVD